MSLLNRSSCSCLGVGADGVPLESRSSTSDRFNDRQHIGGSIAQTQYGVLWSRSVVFVIARVAERWQMEAPCISMVFPGDYSRARCWLRARDGESMVLALAYFHLPLVVALAPAFGAVVLWRNRWHDPSTNCSVSLFLAQALGNDCDWFRGFHHCRMVTVDDVFEFMAAPSSWLVCRFVFYALRDT